MDENKQAFLDTVGQEFLPVYLVISLQHRLRQVIDHVLADLDLTVTQSTLLYATRHGHDISASKLAQWLSLSRQAMTKVVLSLEKRGLIERLPHVSHGRILEIALTEQGKAVADLCEARIRATGQQFMRGLDQQEQHLLVDLLLRCQQNLKTTDVETEADK